MAESIATGVAYRQGVPTGSIRDASGSGLGAVTVDLGSAGVLELRATDSFAASRQIWEDLEARAWMSPYQSHAWLEAWYRHIGSNEAGTPLIVTGKWKGEVALLLPLHLTRPCGVVRCRWLGGVYSNSALPVVAADLADGLDERAILEVLDGVRRLAGGIDYFDLRNQPIEWCGRANPFAFLAGRRAPSPSYVTALQPDFAEFEKQRRTRKGRHGLRRKERRLTEQHGLVTMASAETPEDVATVLAAFFQQRAARFREMGVESVFDKPGPHGFVVEMAERTAASRKSQHLRLHYLKAGTEIVAVYGGSVHNGHYASFFNSFCPSFAAFSPGEILLAKLVRWCCENGICCFDLGIGEGRYKQSWCDSVPLKDVTLAFTLQGRIGASASMLFRSVKSTIKRNEVLWRLAKDVRRRATSGG